MAGVPLVRSFWYLAALLLTACSTSVPAATEQEKSDAMRAYVSCLHNAARKMDDGKSDAATVAIAIKPICAVEFANSVQIAERGANLQVRRMFEDRIQGRQIEIATVAVLDERRAPSTETQAAPTQRDIPPPRPGSSSYKRYDGATVYINCPTGSH
jgi:hypothetical protein